MPTRRRVAAFRKGSRRSGDAFPPVATGGALTAIVPRTAAMRQERARLSFAGVQDFTLGPTITAPRSPSTSVLTAADWGSWAGLYDQFRVTEMRLRVGFPSVAWEASTVITGTFPHCAVVAYDNDTVLSGPSLSTLFQYDNSSVVVSAGVVTYEVRKLPMGAAYGASASGYIGGMEWADVQTPQMLSGSVGLSVDQLAATTFKSWSTVPYFIDWIIEFRGRR